jgi:hypothetical protein
VSAQRLDAAQAAAACARIDTLAAAAKRAGANAPIDYLRVELFLGLLDGRFHGQGETAIVTELLAQYPRRDQTATTGDETATTDDHETATPNHETLITGEFGNAPETAPEPAPDCGQSEPAEPAPSPAPQRGVQVRVGLATLLGCDEQPGELAGWGAVTADVARTIVARQRRSEWRFAILDEHGQLLFDGTTRRRPTSTDPSQVHAVGGIVELHVPIRLLHDPDLARQHPSWAGLLADLATQHATQHRPPQDPAARFPGRALRRHNQITYQHCIFPGCRRPATDSDQDHLRDHAYGGPTTPENLAPACRHDHMNKTARGWRVIRTDERTFVWISPLGRRHRVHLPALAPPLPPPQPRPPDPSADTGEMTGAHGDDAAASSRPTFRPVTQRGRPLAPPPTTGQARLPSDLPSDLPPF